MAYPQAALSQPARAYAPGAMSGTGALVGNNYAGAAYGAQPGVPMMGGMGGAAGGMPGAGLGAGPINGSMAGAGGRGMGGYRMSPILRSITLLMITNSRSGRWRLGC